MDSNVVALVSVTATALVALSGLGTQVWLARRSELREGQRARYDEMIKVYDTAGESISQQIAGLRAIIGLFRSGQRVYSREEWNKAVDEVNESLGIDQNVHSQEALYLFGAPDGVLAAFKAVETAFDRAAEEAATAAAQRQGVLTKDVMKPVDDALELFYARAGMHARSLLD